MYNWLVLKAEVPSSNILSLGIADEFWTLRAVVEEVVPDTWIVVWHFQDH